MTPIAWHWQAHPQPPAPQAAVAWHATIPALLERLQQLSPQDLARLQLTGNRDVLVVSAAPEDLPWADGVGYAHSCPEAPALWLPVLWQPDVSLDLLARALHAQHKRQPLLLWPEPAAVIPLDRLLPGSTALLKQMETAWYAP